MWGSVLLLSSFRLQDRFCDRWRARFRTSRIACAPLNTFFVDRCSQTCGLRSLLRTCILLTTAVRADHSTAKQEPTLPRRTSRGIVDKSPDILEGEKLGNLLQMVAGAKGFGARSLFDSATFAIDQGERVGVIGPNGAGKSTLFKILAGEEELDSGSIVKAQNLRLGYLAQEDDWDASRSVEALLEDCVESPPWEMKRLAAQLGIGPDFLLRPLSSLSGGYRMRVKLAQMLGRRPDVMLLDEPTNYLDLETTLALEKFLLGAPCAFLLISHDREFLRRTTDHILEVESGDVTKYNGGLDDYFEQKEMLRGQLEKRALSASAKRREILDFVSRFGAKATKARQAQSRLKALGKLETIDVKPIAQSARVRIPAPARTGKRVMEVEDCDFGYPGRAVLYNVRFEIARGDRVAIVGRNGAGKSTLLKAFAGELAPERGEIKRGMDARIAYFAQHVAERLDPNDTVLEAMGAKAHPDVARQEILDLAGSLLFSGDSAEKRVRVLSGGEKSRVALGQALLQRAPCLLLDEPTNHLDFGAVEGLAAGLADFEGTVVIVSHDRSFVRRTATKILEVRDGAAIVYPGTYDEYVWSVQKGEWNDARDDESEASPMVGKQGSARANVPGSNYKEEKKRLEREARTLERQLASSEQEMEASRLELAQLTAQLLEASGAHAGELGRAMGLAQSLLDAAEAVWLANGERLEAMRESIARMGTG